MILVKGAHHFWREKRDGENIGEMREQFNVRSLEEDETWTRGINDWFSIFLLSFSVPFELNPWCQLLACAIGTGRILMGRSSDVEAYRAKTSNQSSDPESSSTFQIGSVIAWGLIPPPCSSSGPGRRWSLRTGDCSTSRPRQVLCSCAREEIDAEADRPGNLWGCSN